MVSDGYPCIKSPLKAGNHYSILIEDQKKASIQPWDKQITTKYPEKDVAKRISKKKLDIAIQSKGCGIGSLILNHLIYWGQTLYPQAEIKSLSLSAVDEGVKENKARRDKLYSNIGLINYFGAKPLSQLTPKLSSRDFEVINAHDFLNTILLEKRDLQSECKRSKAANTSLANELRVYTKRCSNYIVTAFLVVFTCLVLYLLARY